MNEEPIRVCLSDDALRRAAEAGADEFFTTVVKAIQSAAGGELTAEVMPRLTPEQITLWGYDILRSEVMDGGFVQLIHNGYGPFFFHNPFAKALREWGIDELARLMKKARPLYEKHREALTRDCTDEEFMALFEQFPKFDTFDDAFVEQEEEFTEQIARYVDGHLDRFVHVG